MTEEFKKRIFEPFSQEGKDARSVYQGTGLGMAIVKRLVEKMGGSITVDSTKDVGANFTVILPMELDHKPAVPKRHAKKEEISVAGMHVLLVDDTELNLDIATFVLEQAGVEVTVAHDGKEAVETFIMKPAGSFDVILMDVMMPVMDGLEAARLIRKSGKPDAATVSIFALTANAFSEDVEKTKAAGMNAHLSKPIEAKALIAALYKVKK